MVRITITLLLSVIAGSTLASAGAESAPKFSPDDIFNLEYVSDPQFTPNGKQVYFVRNFMDKTADLRRSNIWRVDADGSDLRPVTSGRFNDSAPRLSPSGEVLAYVSNRSGKPQIHLYWLDNGQDIQISHLPKAPSSLTWSPDGKYLAFAMFVPGKKDNPIKVSGKPEDAKWAEPVSYTDKLVYRVDGGGYLKPGNKQLFVMSRDGGTPRQLTSGDFNHDGPLAWSGDSQSIYFSANRHDNHQTEVLNSEIYRISLAGSEIQQVTDRFGPDQHPEISPDGKQLAYLGFDDKLLGYHNAALYVRDLASGETRMVKTAEDRSVDSFRWDSDSESIVYQYDDFGATKLARTSLDGDSRDLVVDAGGLSLGRPYDGAAFSVAPNGAVAYTQTDGSAPAELALFKGRKKELITSVNGDLIPFRDMATIEEVRFKSAYDQREIQGWVAYPPGFDANKKYPLVLEIHGGPFANYGKRFAAEIQLFAAAGNVVLYLNPRGSTSYGAEFANLIHHNYPSQDYDDLMSGVDAMLAQGFIDEEQLYVTGGSGGGTLTAWIIGHTDRFRAAVVAKPVINWESFVLTADISPFFTKYWFSGMPWEKPEEYRRRSPLTYAGDVKTPTMLLTGEEDFRTPISESEQYYKALKLQGVPASMVRVPGASHGIAARPSQLVAKVAAIQHWFDQYAPKYDEPVLSQAKGAIEGEPDGEE